MKRTILLALGLVMTLMIKAELLPYPTTEHNGALCYVYSVEKSIGLYRISLNFGVPQQTIIKYNPQLKTRGLHFGETLYIPVPEREVAALKAAKKAEEDAAKAEKVRENAEQKASAKAEKAKERLAKAQEKLAAAQEKKNAKAEKALKPLESNEQNEELSTPIAIRAYESKDSLRIGLLVPLFAHTDERTLAMDRFVDFYEGALMAVYDVQEAGQPIALHVFDTEKGTTKMMEILSRREMAYMNGILGPAYPNQVDILSRYIERYRIPTLIPFTDQVKDIDSNPYLLQFNAPVEDEAEAIATELAKDTLVNCIFVEAEERDIPESVVALRRAIRAKGIRTTTTTIRRILADSLDVDMARGKENVLILNTEKFANARLLLPHIALSSEGKLLTLLSQYSWQKERILVPQIYATEFATDAEPNLQHYNQLYARYFGHEHAGDMPRYDLLGYDLMRELIAYLTHQPYHGLQSDVSFRRVNSENGGCKNKNIHVIRKK